MWLMGFPAFLSREGSTETPSARKHFPLCCRVGLFSRVRDLAVPSGPGNSHTMLHCLCSPTCCCCCFDTLQTWDTQGLCHPAVAGEMVLNTVILFSGSHESILIMFQTYRKTQTTPEKQTNKTPPNTLFDNIVVYIGSLAFRFL